jgi:hypothetical protein
MLIQGNLQAINAEIAKRKPVDKVEKK